MTNSPAVLWTVTCYWNIFWRISEFWTWNSVGHTMDSAKKCIARIRKESETMKEQIFGCFFSQDVSIMDSVRPPIVCSSLTSDRFARIFSKSVWGVWIWIWRYRPWSFLVVCACSCIRSGWRSWLRSGCIIRFPWYCMRGKLESEIRRKWRPWWKRTLHLCCCLLNEWWPCRLLHRREASPWTWGTRHVSHPHVLVGWSWRRGCTIHLQVVLLQHLRIVQCLLNSFQLESQVVLVLDSC